MISADGWIENCIWEHSQTVRELYARRCRCEVEEMTCAAQAAELLIPSVEPGDTLLDVGCGSGYFYHSLRGRQVSIDYYGIDAAPSLIDIGHRIMPDYGLPRERLRVMRIEDLTGSMDHVVCMNVLSNIDNYPRPLERILKVARKTVILRESVAEQSSFRYVADKYLDDGVDLRVHVNTYARSEWIEFINRHGFDVRCITDRRTGGAPEMVIDHPHHWSFFHAARRTS